MKAACNPRNEGGITPSEDCRLLLVNKKDYVSDTVGSSISQSRRHSPVTSAKTCATINRQNLPGYEPCLVTGQE